MKIKFLSILLILTISLSAQNTLKMGASGGPSGSGPSTSSQTVTLYQNGTTAYSPNLTVTYTLSNQQFPAGTLEGITQPGMTVAGSLNSSANSPMGSRTIYTNMNGISSPLNTMFSGCVACGPNTGIDVTTDKAVDFFTCADALINSSTVNQFPLNSRVYYGDLTITFNRPVSNPVFHFVGMGGDIRFTYNNKIYYQGFATEFDLVGNSVSLSKLDGNAYFDVSSNQINNSATWVSASSQGSTTYNVTRFAASGSVVANGGNITSITFKVYLRGDGGRVTDGTGNVVTPDAGITPTWSLGSTNPNGSAGFVSGDTYLLGVSIEEPYEICDDGWDNDWDNLIDCADDDCGNATIITKTVSSCIDHLYADVATLDVTVSWSGNHPNEKIEVAIDGKTEYIDVPGGATSPATVSFLVPADGSTNNSITANFAGYSCQDTDTYNAPSSCSNDQLNCSVLYICGDSKGADADAFDHGLMEYIDGINGNAILIGALAKNVSGQGLYDPMNTSTLTPYDIDTFNIILVSSTTWGDISSTLKTELKETEANVLLLNHDILLDLAMASSQSYSVQTHAYSDNTTLVELYSFNNSNPRWDEIVGWGNYHTTTADAYLWKNQWDAGSNQQGVFFHYDADDVLGGVPSTHGARTFLGYMMDGVYWNLDTNMGATPVPQAEWFDPIRHLTLQGKDYLDQAINKAALGCAVEDCTNGIDDDGDGFVDCADPDCQVDAPSSINLD